MKPKHLKPWLWLGFGLTSITALGAWNLWFLHQASVKGNVEWVQRVSDMVAAERLSLNRTLEQFPDEPIPFLLQHIPRSNRSVVALIAADMKTHRVQHWSEPLFERFITTLDPRLVVLELKAMETRETQTGPVIFLNKRPYYTAVVPLEGSKVLVGFAAARRLSTILRTESRLWRRHVFVYDFDGSLLFASRDTSMLEGVVADTLRQARTSTPSGGVSLERRYAWKWVATYHYDAASDWIFIVAEPAVWTYAPFVSFLACLIGLLWLVRIPVRAAEQIHLQQYKRELGQFARRVEGFVHGVELTLKEPPYTFPELTPIVAAMRWLMPQWQKAAAFPQELGLERKLLGLLIESLPEAIMFFNAQGVMQLSNELGRVFFGLQQEAGREYKVVKGMQVPRGFLEPFVDPVFTAGQQNLGKEVEVAWADGKHLYRVWVEAVEESAGKVAGYIIVIRDITFRKQWEYVQEQVLSGITHDLRGPLSAVMGYLDLLKRQVGDGGNPKVLEYLKMAREAGVRLTQMVTDILDVVRFEQGKIDLEISPITVADIFKRLKGIFSVTAEQKKVQLRLESVGTSDMKTYGDPKLLERIFDNLVSNAIKFTPSGGTITVTARRGKGRMLFDVVDTGRGIPREAQSRIFDKFQQVRPGDRSGGYGLGLAVVKFIVEAHEGEIRVESEVGAGSCFSFWIPDRPDAVAANQGVTPMSA
jgi:PAS domain S-box-containing protein